MNKIKLFFSFFAILLVVASCNPEPELPVVLFEDAQKGAYPRLLNFEGVFNFLDVDNSSVAWDVEFYDEDNGSHVTEYSWTVAYRDNTGRVDPADSTLTIFDHVGEMPLATIPSNLFETVDESGLPGASASWTMTQVLDAFGFTIDSINGGDAFNFFATLKRDDGKEFNTVNTGDAIEGSAPFSGFFRFTMNVVCPSELAGTYTATATGTSTDGCCPGIYNSTVEVVLEENSLGEYSISDWSGGLYYDWYGPDGGNYGINRTNVAGTFLDACETASFGHTTEPFGNTVEALGTADGVTKVIEYSWSNGWGDEGTVKLTPL